MRLAPLLSTALLLAVLLPAGPALAQERPQSSGPTKTREAERAERDSLRQRSRVRFRDRETLAEGEAAEGGEADTDGAREQRRRRRYEPDRALLMPAMERRAVFRIGVPGWLVRAGTAMGREEFDSDEEYRATRALLRGLKSIRVAAFVDNSAYDPDKLRRQYARYASRRRMEPVLFVKAPGGGVSIDVKERRGRIKRITLLAYGEEGGAAVIRIKSRFSPKHLRRAIALMTQEVDEELGIEIDVGVD